MSENIYVPIDYSDVQNRMIEPIIYSSLYKGHSQKTNEFTDWMGHLLITKTGLGYTIPPRKKGRPIEVKYVNLWKLKIPSGSKILLSRGALSISQLSLAREPNFETKKRFKQRRKEFRQFFLGLLLQSKGEWLDANRDNPYVKNRLKKKIMKQLKLCQRRLK